MNMIWTPVNFGKYRAKGKTLPQNLFHDPHWFFWTAIRNAEIRGQSIAAFGWIAELHRLRLPIAASDPKAAIE